MSEINNSNFTGDVLQPFPSLTSLRAAHRELLKQHREIMEQHEFSEVGAALPRKLAQEVEIFISQGRLTGVIIDTEEDRWNCQSLLDYWTTVLYRAGDKSPDATLLDFDPQKAPEISNHLCPYMGLDAFGETHGKLFFGRHELIEEMTDRLGKGCLLALVGLSGPPNFRQGINRKTL